MQGLKGPGAVRNLCRVPNPSPISPNSADFQACRGFHHRENGHDCRHRHCRWRCRNQSNCHQLSKRHEPAKRHKLSKRHDPAKCHELFRRRQQFQRCGHLTCYTAPVSSSRIPVLSAADCRFANAVTAHLSDLKDFAAKRIKTPINYTNVTALYPLPTLQPSTVPPPLSHCPINARPPRNSCWKAKPS